eukprot:TRINITY_DN9561_c2_g1_i2.p1 TRINITY_DN9561_c2_g1~~TRINITY_DN9561_c2_g1_i2.p1  ORF type:complete len:177 (+),score=16.56 TRINITY_DN9561_c2_g1_i2:704-1234(+)
MFFLIFGVVFVGKSHITQILSWTGLYRPSTYQLKLSGWYLVLKWVSTPSFLYGPRGSYCSCLAHVAGPSMKFVGLAREGSVGKSHIAQVLSWTGLYRPSTYQLKLSGWYLVLKRVSTPSFLYGPRGSYCSCLAHVAGPSMKFVGLAREGSVGKSHIAQVLSWTGLRILVWAFHLLA